MRTSIFILGLLVLATITSCSPSKDPVPTSNSNIYASGTAYYDVSLVATYWKNGKEANTLTDGTAYSHAYAIAVAGSDVYVAGDVIDPAIQVGFIPAYWKNGVKTYFKGEGEGSAAAMVVDQSGGVHAVGWFSIDGEIFDRATYWKDNSIVSNLSDGTRNAYATSIALVGTDSYVGGYEETKTSNVAGKYWFNGHAVIVSDTVAGDAAVNAIAAGSGGIYTAGYQGKDHVVAMYWKNNNGAFQLSDNTRDAYATSIFVVNHGTYDDVFVGGYEEFNSASLNHVAKYWKNGSPTILTDGTRDARVTSIFVVGTDVYAAGYEKNDNGVGYAAKYWKNKTAINMSPITTNNGGFSDERLYSIFVTE